MTTSGSMKGFFRQKKKNPGIAKSPSKPKPKASSKRSPKLSVTFGSDLPQPAALISHGSLDLKDDYDEQEEVLRQFDMNMAYGPCLGMTRLERWECANSLGMNPPENVENLIRGGKVGLECLWDGHV